MEGEKQVARMEGEKPWTWVESVALGSWGGEVQQQLTAVLAVDRLEGRAGGADAAGSPPSVTVRFARAVALANHTVASGCGAAASAPPARRVVRNLMAVLVGKIFPRAKPSGRFCLTRTTISFLTTRVGSPPVKKITFVMGTFTRKTS